MRHHDLAVAETADDSHAEEPKLSEAIDKAKQQLAALQHQLPGQANASKAAIFAAHQEAMLFSVPCR